jgi:hypothetical protein
LLFEAGLQGSFGEAFGGGLSDLLHGVQIDVEPGALVAKDAAGDDFAPLGGEGADFVQSLRRKLVLWHGASSCARVRGERPVAFLQLTIGKRLGNAKGFMAASGSQGGREVREVGR